MSSPPSRAKQLVRMGSRQSKSFSSSASALPFIGPVPSSSPALASPFSPVEQAAAVRLQNFFRALVFRRRWLRLSKVLLVKQAILKRVEIEKEQAVRREAALLLFRVWKRRNRSVFGVVKRVMEEQKTPTRAALEQTCDFSANFSSPEHVDWEDMTTIGSRVFSGFFDVKSSDLKQRVAEIVEDDTLFEEGADLENDKLEMDKSMGLDKVEVELERKQRVKVTAKIDACTPEALVFFSCNPDYEKADSLWQTVAMTFLDWSKDDLLIFKLIRLLQNRFHQGSPEVRTLVSERLRLWSRQQGAMDKFALYDSHWIQFFGQSEEDEFLSQLRSMVRTEASRHGKFSQKRRHRLDENELRVLSHAGTIAPIEPPGPKPWKIPAISPIELARQMTLVEAEIFSLLKPSEFFHNAWNSKRKEVLAGNLSLLTGRFNQVASWVSSLILAEKSAKDRGCLIEYFIMVQRELFSMKNFHGVMELHAVLSSAHISRLRQSWKVVSPVNLLTFARIDTLMSPSSNYREYRKLLRSAEGSPCLPYLGAWLTDLTFIGESRTWIDRTEEKFPPLLNISKLSKIAGVLMAIQQFQKLPFPFCHQKDISYYLMSEVSAAPRRKDQELYEISIALEPRDPNFQQKMALRNQLKSPSRFGLDASK